MVIGRHSDDMLPLPRYCTVSGVPVDQLIDSERLEAIFAETREAGGLIVEMAQRANAYYGPSAVAAELAEAIYRDSRRTIPVSLMFTGQYGIEGAAMSLPAVIGRGRRGEGAGTETDRRTEEKTDRVGGRDSSNRWRRTLMNKVSVIGAGNVGATAVYYIAGKNIADIVMVDVLKGLPQSKALDFLHAAPLGQYNINILGTDDYAEIADSDVIVLTAGDSEKAGHGSDGSVEDQRRDRQNRCSGDRPICSRRHCHRGSPTRWT